jgi:hypothetical protein
MSLFQLGQDPDLDAWVTNFFTENHLAYETFPDEVASPEQLNFIVHMDGEPFYYPCSDKLFEAIINKRADSYLTTAYSNIWGRLERLVHEVVNDDYKRSYLLNLLSIKYQHEISSKVQLPSRMEKRLLGILTTISEISRPLGPEKERHNHRVQAFLESEFFRTAFNSPQGIEVASDTTLDDLDLQLHLLRLKRLLALSTVKGIWEEETPPNPQDLLDIMNGDAAGEQWHWWRTWVAEALLGRRRPTILWIGVRSGEVIFDLAIIRILMKMGIKVILAVKQGFYFHQISFIDILEDPILETMLDGADIITDNHITKNELLRRLGSDQGLLVISDGTQEPFNPLLASVTFARAFKEADLVVSRCAGSRECIDNRFDFTRDMISIIRQDPGQLDILFKPHHPKAVRFSENSLRRMADNLIQSIRREREAGKTIMFYSAIVGSIPGQMATAKSILNVFVQHLRSTLHDVVIINPGEHFVEGMDADDIMYMWEIFQRSGVIDIWRFQTVDDIEKSFELMGEKVPPEWTGKDSTYSTGCTKEMNIAMDMLKRYPEMQIIGPSWEKFLRRKEYGVGKLYDRALVDGN